MPNNDMLQAKKSRLQAILAANPELAERVALSGWDMEEFIDSLEQRFKILDKKTFFIIEDLKKEEFMSDSNLI